MHEPDSPTPLTDEELTLLLAPVPLAHQQREAMVRITLRPGLATTYAGPVTLTDLLLSLSPWHWLHYEMANSPQSIALTLQLVEARAAGCRLETVAEIASWICEYLFDEEKDYTWNPHPGDGMHWGHYGIVSDRDGHFLPPSFDLQAVIFIAEESPSEGVIVAQAEWENWPATEKAIGPVRVFGMPDGARNTWLYTADELWLTDPTTGESCLLVPDTAWANDDKSKNPTDWTGHPPAPATLSGTSGEHPVLEAGLRYEAGQLFRADTNTHLTLGLYCPPVAIA